MIRVDAVWMAVQPLDMRLGTEAALALWLNGLIVGYSRPPGLDDVLAEALGG